MYIITSSGAMSYPKIINNVNIYCYRMNDLLIFRYDLTLIFTYVTVDALQVASQVAMIFKPFHLQVVLYSDFFYQTIFLI